jgi:ribulose-5-phosphate 4-epimerase/fuculose-1-phosphate aldolase
MHTPNTLPEKELTQLRIDLAAAFRLAVKFDWHESVGNHFSAAVSADGKHFLLNPKWKHFSEICASDLLLLDADQQAPELEDDLANTVDKSAWCIHGAVHKVNPKARVVLHLHPPYATALASLKDPTLYPIDQNTARFFGMGVDTNFGGMADSPEEGRRIGKALLDSNSKALIMRNHGVTIIGESVAEAFEDMYFFERAAKTLMLAYASGQPLSIMSDQLASETAKSWHSYRGAAFEHFDYLKRQLDAIDDTYKN